jgi:hypothetical protein
MPSAAPVGAGSGSRIIPNALNRPISPARIGISSGTRSARGRASVLLGDKRDDRQHVEREDGQRPERKRGHEERCTMPFAAATATPIHRTAAPTHRLMAINSAAAPRRTSVVPHVLEPNTMGSGASTSTAEPASAAMPWTTLRIPIRSNTTKARTMARSAGRSLSRRGRSKSRHAVQQFASTATSSLAGDLADESQARETSSACAPLVSPA